MIPPPARFLADPEIARLLKKISRTSGHTPAELLAELLRSRLIRKALRDALEASSNDNDGSINQAFEPDRGGK